VTVLDTVTFVTDNEIRSWLNQGGMHLCKNISNKFKDIFHVNMTFWDEPKTPTFLLMTVDMAMVAGTIYTYTIYDININEESSD
jgi:hypothetical protein